jgi:hypothetical protein
MTAPSLPPLSARMYCGAISRRLLIIARQFDEAPWADFPKVDMQTQRLMAALLREVAIAIEEESRR